MLVHIRPPVVEMSSASGATVATRKVRFGSQPEQIVYLRGMIEQYRETYQINAKARDVAFRQRGARPRDQVGQALAIGSWVQDTITYVNELPERFQTPPTTIAEGYGDCDDFSTLIGSMCESLGIAVELVGMEWGEGDGRSYKHIFPRAVVPMGQLGGAVRVVRVPLDATLTAPVDGRHDPIRIALARGVRNLRLFVQ